MEPETVWVALLSTLKLVVPLTVPLVAVIVPFVAVIGAVRRPDVPIVPAVVVQVNDGVVVRALPNWSLAVAVNCCVAPALTVGDDGLTTMLVSVWFTVTLTLLVAVSPSGSVMVTVKP